MAFTFSTAQHLPEGTPYDQIYFINVQSDDAHAQQAYDMTFIGGQPMRDFVQQGLSEGWLTIIEEYKRPGQA